MNSSLLEYLEDKCNLDTISFLYEFDRNILEAGIISSLQDTFIRILLDKDITIKQIMLIIYYVRLKELIKNNNNDRLLLSSINSSIHNRIDKIFDGYKHNLNLLESIFLIAGKTIIVRTEDLRIVILAREVYNDISNKKL